MVVLCFSFCPYGHDCCACAFSTVTDEVFASGMAVSLSIHLIGMPKVGAVEAGLVGAAGAGLAGTGLAGAGTAGAAGAGESSAGGGGGEAGSTRAAAGSSSGSYFQYTPPRGRGAFHLVSRAWLEHRTHCACPTDAYKRSPSTWSYIRTYIGRAPNAPMRAAEASCLCRYYCTGGKFCLVLSQ